MKLKFTTIGPIPRDTITTPDDEVLHKYGCIMQATIGLSSLVGEEADIFPVSHVRKVDEKPIKDILKAQAGVQLQHITSDADRGAVIDLLYLNNTEKVGRQTAYMNPILEEDLAELLDSNVFIFTPVTDYEVPLDTLKYVSQNSEGLIIYNAHGFTSSVATHGERIHKFWIDRDIWLPYIDILMMNLNEARCCWFEHEYNVEDLEDNHPLTPEEAQEMATHFLSKGLKALFITSDDACQSAIFTMKDGMVHTEKIHSINLNHQIVDTTGCAEAYAAGLAYGLSQNATDYASAAKYGNTMAALRIQGESLECYKTLEEVEDLIQRNFK